MAVPSAEQPSGIQASTQRTSEAALAIELSKDLTQTLIRQARQNNRIFLQRHAHLILFALQDLAHGALRQFLEGGTLSRGSKVLYPLWRGSRPEKIRSFQRALTGLMRGWALAGREPEMSLEAAADSPVTETAFLQELTGLYRFLDRAIENFSERQDPVEVKTLGPETLKGRETRFLRWIARLERKVAVGSEFTRAFYLTGSLADGRWVEGYSDVDAAMILRRETVCAPEKIFRARRYLLALWKVFYEIDPLQHHGIHCLTEIDMDFYPQSYFPFCLFRESVPLGPEKPLRVRERDDALACRNRRYQMEQVIRSWREKKIPVRDLYTWKSLCQYWIFYPLIVLQSLGCPVYKKNFFDLSYREGITHESWERVSRCRSTWNARESGRWSWRLRQSLLRGISPVVNVFVLQRIAQRLFHTIPGWALHLVPEEAIRSLADELENVSMSLEPIKKCLKS